MGPVVLQVQGRCLLSLKCEINAGSLTHLNNLENVSSP